MAPAPGLFMSFLSLFTTPPAPEPAAAPAAGGVADALRQGAEGSGVSFDYLMRTATRESALDPQAKASTSSATGLFQFIEQTWLAAVKADGGKYGLQNYSDAIGTGASGRLAVADPALRAEILALRKDPKVSAVLAGELARRNGVSLADTLGRAPSDGELYVAHVLGARGAASLLAKASATPDLSAAAYFPIEAAANRGLFYTAGGRPRTLDQLRRKLADGFGADAATATAASARTATAQAAPQAAGAWLSFFPGARADTGRPLDGLFSTEGVRGPVTASVKTIWTASAQSSSRESAYFPTGAGGALEAPTPAKTAERPAIDPAAAASAPASGRKPKPGKPLDLQAFMKPVAA